MNIRGTRRRHDELSMRPRWLVIAACVAMFVAILITNGVTTSQIGVDADGAAPNGRDDAVPAVVKNGGPVIDTTRGRTASLVPPSKTVALTFDDGPDPQWTPQALAVLAKYHVPATFFVVGSRAARHPDLVRAIAASGSEIGLHMFTHPDLGEVSAPHGPRRGEVGRCRRSLPFAHAGRRFREWAPTREQTRGADPTQGRTG